MVKLASRIFVLPTSPWFLDRSFPFTPDGYGVIYVSHMEFDLASGNVQTSHSFRCQHRNYSNTTLTGNR